MLAQASTTVSFPPASVASLLSANHRARSVQLDGDGAALLDKVGVKVGGIPIYKHVELKLEWSSAALLADRLMLPVSWVAVGGPPLFPRMEGTLHVEPDAGGSSRITLNARYDPPLGKLGLLVDRVAMHRVAQLTMDDFVKRLACELEDELRD